MRPHIIWTIFRKEITEALRDRLALLMIIGLPVLLYPVLILGMGKLQMSQTAAQEKRASRIAVWGEAPAQLLNALDATNSLKWELWQGAPAQLTNDFLAGKIEKPVFNSETNEAKDPVFMAARKAVSDREIDAVLVLWPGFANALSNGALGELSIFYDSVRPASEKAQDRVREQLSEFRKTIVEQRERERGLPKGFSKAIDIVYKNVASQTRKTGQFLGTILPLLIIMLSGTAAAYASADLTAGEKERGTMQTLLCAPLRPSEIVTGKFLTVWTLSLLAALANLVSMAATFARVTGFGHLEFSNYLLMFLALWPVTFTVSAILITIAAFAKDVKEAGNFSSGCLVAMTLPLAISLTPGVELTAWTALFPLVNLALVIKALFIGDAKVDVVFIALTCSAAYGTLAVLFAARVFAREQILLGGKESFWSMFAIERKEGSQPTPTFVLTACAVLLIVIFYGSVVLRKAGVLPMLLVVEYGFLLLPALLLAKAMKFSFRQTFSLRPLSARSVIGAIIIGLSAWTVAAGLIRLVPPPDDFLKEMAKMVSLDNAPLWLLVLVIAITPAICEEVVFRGLIFSGLKPLGRWPTILISAFLFALPHASVYRLLPTFFLGIVLGWVVWRTGSIFCSMIIHSINNGLVAVVAYYALKTPAVGGEKIEMLPWSVTLGGAAVLAIGLWIVRSKPIVNSTAS